MDANNVNLLVLQYKDKIPSEKVVVFKTALEASKDEKVSAIAMARTYNPVLVMILSIFLGGWGIDRFYIGDVGLGIAKLLVGWLTLFIWPLVDIYCCYYKAKQKNFDTLMAILKEE